jgi:Uma2 family endonuclease
MAAPRLMTTQQYLMTDETLRPQELIFGALRVADAPKPRHQQLVAELFVPMALHVRQGRLGTMWLSPLDVVLDDEKGLVVQPDMFFIGRDRLPFVPDRIRLAPDLMVEVLSPLTRLGSDPEERLAWFAAYGVSECWLVHQFQLRTEVVRFENGKIAARQSYGFDVPLRSSVLPDFRPVLYEVLDSSLGTRDS